MVKLSDIRKRDPLTYGSVKLANMSAILGVIFYCSGRYIEALIKFSDYTMRRAAVLQIYGFMLLVVIVVMIRFVRRNREVILATFVPLTLYAFHLLGSLATEDFEFFFILHLAICGICCLYQHFRASVIYLVLTTISNVSLFLVYFPNLDVSVTRVAYSSNRNVPSGILFIDAFIGLISALGLLVLTRVASRKSGEANRDLLAFETLLASTPSFMVLINEMKQVMYISEPLAHLAQAENREIATGRPLLDLFRSRELKLLFSDIIDSNGLLDETCEIVIDGQMKYFKVIASRLLGTVDGLFIDLTDVTPVFQSKLEADSARQAAEHANRAKSDFLARMSHEIRTPMNAIVGMGDLMRTDNLDKTQTGYFNDIRRSSKALMQIINDILDFSKIEAEKLDILPIDFSLNMLYDNMCSLNAFATGVKDLEFRTQFESGLPDVVFGDEIRVRQILNNLLSNAIKYTHTGYVSFTVRHAGNRGDRSNYGNRGDHGDLVNHNDRGNHGDHSNHDSHSDHSSHGNRGDHIISFIVEDSGIGIKKEDMPRLFISFEQIDQVRNRGIVGTGLGLSIVKRLTDLMGGEIEVHSEYGVGSRFTVHLPLPPGDPSKIESVTSSPHVIARPGTSVLVVDDNQINLTVARAFLATHGIDVDVTTSGYDAIEKIKKQEYDIVFMDHMMPDINGMEATRLIRAADALRLQSLPIIALTANAVMGERKAFLTAGMSDYLAKPILSEDMNRMLKKWLPAGRILRYETKSGSDAVAEDSSMAGRVINTKRGLMYSAGSESMYFQLLTDFSRYQRDTYKNIVDGLADGDIALVYRLAHTFKNTARMIGADALADAAQAIEAGLSDGEARCTDEQLYIMRQEFLKTHTEIERLIADDGEFAQIIGATINSNNKLRVYNEYDISKLTEDLIYRARGLLDSLAPLVKSHRAAAFEYIGEIEGALAPFGDMARGLARQIENYDFKNALETINTIDSLLSDAERELAATQPAKI
ncbi:MAG: ATP-binding protein [Oscillospiraceae bacterium]|nr:ATP-binding protein [Oscillospiraceae bacterium]